LLYSILMGHDSSFHLWLRACHVHRLMITWPDLTWPGHQIRPFLAFFCDWLWFFPFILLAHSFVTVLWRM
jgi:hypothetical protein